MNRRKSLSIIIVSLFAWTALLGADIVAAETRSNLLGDFFVANQTTAGSFKNSNLEEPLVDEVTIYSTFASLQSLEILDRLDDIGKPKAAVWTGEIMRLANISNDIANFYYSSVSYKLVNESFDLVGDFETYYVSLLELQDTTTNGFQSGSAELATVSDTYFAVASLAAVGLLGNISFNAVATYIMSCWVPLQGFGGYEDASEANLIDTLYALQTLELLDQMSQVSADQKTVLGDMVQDHYIDDPDYALHYGAYGIPRTIPFGDITTTYYCVTISELLGLEMNEETLTWLLKRQNGDNYGFQDLKEDGTTTSSSSILSYYAISSILILDEEGLEGAMSEDDWQLKTPIGAIIGIVVGIVGVIAIIVLLIWRYKTKI